jgi:enoyl-CoA hydratase/carnithine racemase
VIQYETYDGRAVVTIDDPERRNPLTTDAMDEIRRAVDSAAADEGVRAIVITGAGDRAFSAGGDLGGGFVDRPIESHGPRGAFADMFRAIRGADKPVIARVNGHALAGGLGLVAGCDIVHAVEGATFGATEIRVGLWPMMISAVLVRVIPARAAFDLMITGRRLAADEAQRLGIVSRVVPTLEALDEAVEETVAAIKNTPAGVVALGRSAFYGAQDLSLDAALDVLHAGLTAVAMTDDAREGVEAFLEKRPPDWSGV